MVIVHLSDNQRRVISAERGETVAQLCDRFCKEHGHPPFEFQFHSISTNMALPPDLAANEVKEVLLIRPAQTRKGSVESYYSTIDDRAPQLSVRQKTAPPRPPSIQIVKALKRSAPPPPPPTSSSEVVSIEKSLGEADVLIPDPPSDPIPERQMKQLPLFTNVSECGTDPLESPAPPPRGSSDSDSSVDAFPSSVAVMHEVINIPVYADSNEPYLASSDEGELSEGSSIVKSSDPKITAEVEYLSAQHRKSCEGFVEEDGSSQSSSNVDLTGDQTPGGRSVEAQSDYKGARKDTNISQKVTKSCEDNLAVSSGTSSSIKKTWALKRDHSPVEVSSEESFSHKSDRKEEDISGRKEEDISGRKEKDISGRKEDIYVMKEEDISVRKEVDISGRKEMDISVRKEMDISGRKEMDISVRKEVDISVRKEKDISGRKEMDISVRKEKDISVRKEEEISDQIRKGCGEIVGDNGGTSPSIKENCDLKMEERPVEMKVSHQRMECISVNRGSVFDTTELSHKPFDQSSQASENVAPVVMTTVPTSYGKRFWEPVRPNSQLVFMSTKVSEGGLSSEWSAATAGTEAPGGDLTKNRGTSATNITPQVIVQVAVCEKYGRPDYKPVPHKSFFFSAGSK